MKLVRARPVSEDLPFREETSVSARPCQKKAKDGVPSVLRWLGSQKVRERHPPNINSVPQKRGAGGIRLWLPSLVMLPESDP
jgi:hypothetical protein